jgi:hypothetical protein
LDGVIVRRYRDAELSALAAPATSSSTIAAAGRARLTMPALWPTRPERPTAHSFAIMRLRVRRETVAVRSLIVPSGRLVGFHEATAGRRKRQRSDLSIR